MNSEKLRCDKSHFVGSNPSTIVPMVPLPNNGVPDEPVRWGNSTREAKIVGASIARPKKM